ncbi:MAG: hypothetical protein HON42_02040 [Alphaproteobacteria bacterium]|jgi:hypothetical protein|nr:hypothetical protein [Alphaproteobacteria bacterium]
MNIFITSFNSKEAASHLDDLRLNKMILETAQLLSSAYRHLFGDDELLYKDTHFNHPCAIWAREGIDSYSWLVQYFDDLAKEKIRRDNTIKKKLEIKPHKSWRDLFELFNYKKTDDFKDKISAEFFDFNCTDFKGEKDVRIAYQKQMIKKWEGDLRPPKWTGANKPVFDFNLNKITIIS